MIPSRFYYPSPGFAIYWQRGNGKKLAENLTRSFPEKEEIEQLIPRLFEPICWQTRSSGKSTRCMDSSRQINGSINY